MLPEEPGMEPANTSPPTPYKNCPQKDEKQQKGIWKINLDSDEGKRKQFWKIWHSGNETYIAFVDNEKASDNTEYHAAMLAESEDLGELLQEMNRILQNVCGM